MIKWMKKFRYDTVEVLPLPFLLVKSGGIDELSVLLQENGFEWRRLVRAGPRWRRFPRHSEHYLWHRVAVPWRDDRLSQAG